MMSSFQMGVRVHSLPTPQSAASFLPQDSAAADQLVLGGLRHRAHHDLVQIDVVRQRHRLSDDLGHVLGQQGLSTPS